MTGTTSRMQSTTTAKSPNRTRLSLSSGRGLRLSADGITIGLDVKHHEDGSFSVVVAEPFDAEVHVTKANGRRRYLISAPDSTRIQKELAE